MFTDLAEGTPEAQAAFYNGYRASPLCAGLGGGGTTGGLDQFGGCVLNPAGLDLSGTAADQLGLCPGHVLTSCASEWMTVSFLWEDASPASQGYWTTTRTGDVFTFGDSSFQGSTGGEPVDPVVAMARS